MKLFVVLRFIDPLTVDPQELVKFALAAVA